MPTVVPSREDGAGRALSASAPVTGPLGLFRFSLAHGPHRQWARPTVLGRPGAIVLHVDVSSRASSGASAARARRRPTLRRPSVTRAAAGAPTPVPPPAGHLSPVEADIWSATEKRGPGQGPPPSDTRPSLEVVPHDGAFVTGWPGGVFRGSGPFDVGRGSCWWLRTSRHAGAAGVEEGPAGPPWPRPPAGLRSVTSVPRRVPSSFAQQGP